MWFLPFLVSYQHAGLDLREKLIVYATAGFV
jgi:hypothetical protein